MKYLNVKTPALALALGLTLAAAAHSADLRLTSFVAPTHFGTKLIIEPLIAKITEYSGGELNVTNYPGGQLANAPGTLNAVKTGVANMGLLGIGYASSAMPMSTIIELPGAFVSLKQGQAAYSALVTNKLAAAEFLPNGVRPIMVTMLPQQQLVLRENRPINSLADLKGLKIRVPHAEAGNAISALGMVPVQIPQADLYLALERGTVDGAVNLIASVASYKLNEVTKTATTNLALGSVAFAIVINERDWKKLSDKQQQALMRAGAEIGAKSAEELTRVNAGAEKKLADGGMNMVAVSDAMQAEVKAALAGLEKDWVADVAKRNAMAGDVAAAFKAQMARN